MVQRLFPEFGFRWVIQDLKAKLKEELDFELEAKNGERCAEELKVNILLDLILDDSL